MSNRNEVARAFLKSGATHLIASEDSDGVISFEEATKEILRGLEWGNRVFPVMFEQSCDVLEELLEKGRGKK